MSSFTNEIKLQALRDNTWLLLESFEFYDEYNNIFVIEKWFITDGASIPKPLRIIWCPMDLPILKAAILHDWLIFKWYDRKYRDEMFLLALGILNINPVKKYVYYLWVKFRSYIKS